MIDKMPEPSAWGAPVSWGHPVPKLPGMIGRWCGWSDHQTRDHVVPLYTEEQLLEAFEAGRKSVMEIK